MPVVPPKYGRREMHPVVLLKETPVAALAGSASLAMKGVEFARFGNRLVIVNHRSSPVRIPGGRSIPQISTAPGWLAAHSATLIWE
jgi:hypothetical protein